MRDDGGDLAGVLAMACTGCVAPAASRLAMPTLPLRASSPPIFSASIDLQNSPALPLPNTLMAFLGSINSMKLCSTKASNWP